MLKTSKELFLNREKEIEAIAAMMISLHSTNFRGKEKGRYSLSRQSLKLLCGVPTANTRIVESLVRDLFEELMTRGFTLIDLDSSFVIMESKTLFNYRKPPMKLLFETIEKKGSFPLSEIASDDEEESEDDDDETHIHLTEENSNLHGNTRKAEQQETEGGLSPVLQETCEEGRKAFR